jgi:hypothetical protein
MPLVITTLFEDNSDKLKFTKCAIKEGHTVDSYEEKKKRVVSEIGKFKRLENIAMIEHTMGDIIRL